MTKSIEAGCLAMMTAGTHVPTRTSLIGTAVRVVRAIDTPPRIQLQALIASQGKCNCQAWLVTGIEPVDKAFECNMMRIDGEDFSHEHEQTRVNTPETVE